MKYLFLLAGIVCLWSTSSSLAQVKGPAMPYPPREAAKPIAPPSLGKYQPAKTAATDPGAEASQALVGKVVIPLSAAPAPFVRSSVPDPFENRQLLQLPMPVPEAPAPPLLLPRK